MVGESMATSFPLARKFTIVASLLLLLRMRMSMVSAIRARVMRMMVVMTMLLIMMIMVVMTTMMLVVVMMMMLVVVMMASGILQVSLYRKASRPQGIKALTNYK